MNLDLLILVGSVFAIVLSFVGSRATIVGPVMFAWAGAAAGGAVAFVRHFDPVYDRVSIEYIVPLRHSELPAARCLDSSSAPRTFGAGATAKLPLRRSLPRPYPRASELSLAGLSIDAMTTRCQWRWDIV